MAARLPAFLLSQIISAYFSAAIDVIIFVRLLVRTGGKKKG
jgi:hypothetical protein